jgi:hypothetical protein
MRRRAPKTYGSQLKKKHCYGAQPFAGRFFSVEKDSRLVRSDQAKDCTLAAPMPASRRLVLTAVGRNRDIML